jgi:biopolymer transport protein ExbD
MSFPASKSRLKHLRKSRGSNEIKGFRPQLTSLVDVLSVLLIYLLQSFSTEGEIITTTKDMILPESSAQKKPELNVTITVNNHSILAESKLVANVDEVISSDDIVIPQLFEWLKQRREMTEKIAMYSSKAKFTGNVTIVGDKRIHFSLLKKIMYTCGQQGYNNFALAVRKKGG